MATDRAAFVRAIKANVALTRRLFEEGQTSEIIGTVSGSDHARNFWQTKLDIARETFAAREAISFHEDLPTNQAFGILLLWQRLRSHLRAGESALVAFVFGEGTRATPFTETDNAQKPAISTFVPVRSGGRIRYLSMVELALQYFVPVEQYLRRSGFEGVVIKWGDEVQIPTIDLAGRNPLFEGADIVRFVSMRSMSESDAANKDWVGVDDEGRVTMFIPRRPLAEMGALADRGLLRRDGDRLVGGINLGSVALSRVFADALLEEFGDEVNDPDADRKQRPDLDPQFFTALTIAAVEGNDERAHAWELAVGESEAMRKLDRDLPRVLSRLRGVLERFERQHGRKVKIVAFDFDDQYWGDIGQHPKIYEFFMALVDRGSNGEIARAIAGIPDTRDANGNIIVGETSIGADVKVTDSVLINAAVESGVIERSVLVGTRASRVRAADAFDVQSTVNDLTLEPRAGSYKVVADEPLRVAAGERVTTLFLPDGEILARVHEDTDLRDRSSTYDVPIHGNAISFGEAHAAMGRVRPEELARRRDERVSKVLEMTERP